VKITFTDGRVFEIDRDLRFTNVEAMAMEKVTGWDLAEIEAKLNGGSVMAITAFVWVAAKRHEPTLRFTEVEFDMTELEQIQAEMAAEDPEAVDPTPASEDA
jgi:hypothetical protein